MEDLGPYFGMTYERMMDTAVKTYGAGSPEVVNLSLTYDNRPAPAPPPLPTLQIIAWGAGVLALYFVLNRSL